MKIKFDFGTQASIPLDIIGSISSGITNMIDTKFGLKAGMCTIYLTLYDNDGVIQTIGNNEGEELMYIVRSKKYQHIPKGMTYMGECCTQPSMHLYYQYKN